MSYQNDALSDMSQIRAAEAGWKFYAITALVYALLDIAEAIRGLRS